MIINKFTAIEKAREKAECEETDLRKFLGDFMTEANTFENSRRHFWDYMRALIIWVTAMFKLDTHDEYVPLESLADPSNLGYSIKNMRDKL